MSTAVANGLGALMQTLFRTVPGVSAIEQNRRGGAMSKSSRMEARNG